VRSQVREKSCERSTVFLELEGVFGLKMARPEPNRSGQDKAGPAQGVQAQVEEVPMGARANVANYDRFPSLLGSWARKGGGEGGRGGGRREERF